MDMKNKQTLAGASQSQVKALLAGLRMISQFDRFDAMKPQPVLTTPDHNITMFEQIRFRSVAAFEAAKQENAGHAK